MSGHGGTSRVHIHSTKVSRRDLLLIGALLFMLIVGLSVGFKSDVQPAYAELSVPPDELSFGHAWMDADFRWTVRIKNTSRVPIRVDDISASCQCANISPRQFVVEPGGVQAVELTIDLTSGLHLADSHVSHPFSVLVVPVVHGLRHDGWILRGTTTSPLGLSPPAFGFFGADALDSLQLSSSVTLDVHPDLPIKLTFRTSANK